MAERMPPTTTLGAWPTLRSEVACEISSARFRNALEENRDNLVAVATRLIEIETLDSDEFAFIMDGVPA